MRSSILLLGIAISVTTACSGTDAGSLVGEYRRHQRVFVFHGNEPEETEVEDRLTLTEVDGGDLRFAFRVTATGAQTCEMQGVAESRRTHFEYRPTASAVDCRLRIRRLGDGEVQVEDVGDACARRHCEAGASIGRTTFRRAR